MKTETDCPTLEPVTLTENQASELLHKFGILRDEADLHEDYGITAEQAAALYDSVPWNGGDWCCPADATIAAHGELRDHAVVLRDQAEDARSNGEKGQALQIHKLANFMDALADKIAIEAAIPAPAPETRGESLLFVVTVAGRAYEGETLAEAVEAAEAGLAPAPVLPLAPDGTPYSAAIRGHHPVREIPAAELPEFAGEQQWRVRLPLGFESNFYLVIGDGLCTADACDAVAEWLESENPDYTDDWEALAESLSAVPAIA